MSTIEVRVPQLPESVADATLVAWRKQPGDAVNRDEVDARRQLELGQEDFEPPVDDSFGGGLD